MGGALGELCTSPSTRLSDYTLTYKVIKVRLLKDFMGSKLCNYYEFHKVGSVIVIFDVGVYSVPIFEQKSTNSNI